MARDTNVKTNGRTGVTPSSEQGGDQQQAQPLDEALSAFKEYAQQRPEVVAMWAFGIGFVLGWKLKPW